ncbi:DUF1450 domain-containing protein [Paenibacillus sp. JMULE4]|uniref:DUF1450 domain-containing protein n=1 Tax=Paenibacillus TaxID=44249 RepID=UPI0015751321|nr:DUF1450 domain-containing protein [Paenibacillus sp. JMULE4]NTZ18010.1 DUF1450 domain-containing protein [Paenibacillus sp. JMULE4]
MRVAKFCERNIKSAGSGEAIDMLQRDYRDEVSVVVVDCFRRCLQCREKPFCRIQLTTIEANDAKALVEKIIQTARRETR